jgi:hypothetical protein
MDDNKLIANILATTKSLNKTYYKTVTLRKLRKPKKRKIKRIKDVGCNYSNNT